MNCCVGGLLVSVCNSPHLERGASSVCTVRVENTN